MIDYDDDRTEAEVAADVEKAAWAHRSVMVPFGFGHVRRLSPARISELKAMTHKEYLRTPEWAERRDLCLEDADGRCEQCGRRGKMNVHHVTYENKPLEQRGDLRVLCRGCHLLCHPEVTHRKLNAFIRSPEYKAAYGDHPNPDSVFGMDSQGKTIRPFQERPS